MRTVVLTLLGVTVALIIIMKCLGCITHLHLRCKQRGHPGEGVDTVEYKSAGLIGNLCYCCCNKFLFCQNENIV
jgi:hypothetical protein